MWGGASASAALQMVPLISLQNVKQPSRRRPGISLGQDVKLASCSMPLRFLQNHLLACRTCSLEMAMLRPFCRWSVYNFQIWPSSTATLLVQVQRLDNLDSPQKCIGIASGIPDNGHLCAQCFLPALNAWTISCLLFPLIHWFINSLIFLFC